MIVLIALLGLIGGLIYFYLAKDHDYWAKRGVPHLKPQFLLGNTPNAVKQKRNMYYDLEDIYE